MVVGIIFAIALSDKFGRIRLQVFGFLGCAVGLVIATLSIDAAGATKLYLIMAGVMLFNFMTNIGPNAQTYLLAGEVFPTEVRGMGAGFAAMIGKVGAVATTFGFPILLVSMGTRTLLYTLAVSSVLGAVVTWMFRIETTGVNLDTDRALNVCLEMAVMTEKLRRALAGRRHRLGIRRPRPRTRPASPSTKPARPCSSRSSRPGSPATRA